MIYYIVQQVAKFVKWKGYAMALELITQKTEEEKAKELADFLTDLRRTQFQIIEALKTFKEDIESLARVYHNQQNEIDRINRRQSNRAKRGGYELDDEEEQQKPPSTERVSG